eukprot:NODE_9_length_64580_cov_1.431941.p2 type:complete len:1144 gc:universal NODE_9_length_64580_cov_1.431941:46758-50189(+)
MSKLPLCLTMDDVESFKRISPSQRGYIICATALIPVAILFPKQNLYTALSGVTGLIIILATVLGSIWSIHFKKFMWYQDDNNGKFCFMQPRLHRGQADIVQIQDQILEFQKMKFRFDNGKLQRIVPRLEFSVDELVSHKGITDASNLIEKFGENHFQIPVPTFIELFKDHLVKPFFLFQIFCVTLWMFDEMWYYSLFTLVMLFVFEATVVMQRLRTLNEFHQMQHPPFDVFCYRSKKWTKVSTRKLVPGDVISIGTSQDIKVEQQASIRNPVKQVVTIETLVPCDAILLKHSCVVNEAILSGESTPVLKESILIRNGQDLINNNSKLHMIYGGTQVLQISEQTGDFNTGFNIPNAPDNGVVAQVLVTGFNTTQGELVRTMVFSSEPVSANSKEAFVFILFLLIFAITAALYVWHVGSQEPTRDKWKLFLNCVMIVTSCVPPELPMELSLAVNTSLMSLARLAIFSTEPFRIPFAGRVDVCCFDKTGTLTEEKLQVEGIVIEDNLVTKTSEIDDSTKIALSTAHSLVKLEEKNEIVGDSMEKAVQEWLGFDLDKDFIKCSDRIQVLRRFPFSSALARMATFCRQSDGAYLTSVKGAPERLRELFVDIPENYDDVFQTYAQQGGRVIAIGFKKEYRKFSSKEIKDLELSTIEKGLTFCGFLVLKSPLKKDALETIIELKQSSHHVVMITGDNSLTACHVAKQLQICDKSIVLITERGGKLIIEDEDKKLYNDFSDINRYKHNICVTGKGFDLVLKSSIAEDSTWIAKVDVWARVSPDQKEFIITQLKELGLFTLMAGDGTNDVGALKQAHVGVALLNGTEEDLDKINKIARIQRLKQVWEKQSEIAKRFGQPSPPQPPELKRYLEEKNEKNVSKTLANREKPTTVEEKRQHAMQNMLASLESVDDDEVPVLKFGDASIAAPFTSKLSQVKAIAHIIRQGRCTLVTTIQMYKILALNCLISAYSMSVLYLQGIKWGDWQMTIQGILLSICFLCISKGKPLDKLSRERPQGNIFNWYVLLSVLGQTLIHGICFYQVTAQVHAIEGELEFDFENKKKFEPSLLNTCIYLLSMSMQVSTFWVNYIGRPFREDIRENSLLYRGLLAGIGVAFAGVLEIFSDFNNFLQLVPLFDVILIHLAEKLSGCCNVV